MNATGVSTVTAYTAHREWASRPPDERYASVQALYDAARERRLRTEERTIDTADVRTEAIATHALALSDADGRLAGLTHWSFEQLAGIAGAPPKYLRSLPAEIASDAINFGLERQGRERQQLFADHADPWTVHAITSPRYARVHHDELARRVLDLMAAHPAWHLPLGYKDGEFGAERVPSGAYLGDRDMFLFLVDGNRDLEDPTDRTHAGLFRGFILRNSDVGAAALTLDLFLFRSSVREPHHLGLPAYGRLPAPPHRRVDSRGVDRLARPGPRLPRRRHRRRSHRAPAGHDPGAWSDARRRDRTRPCGGSSCRRSRPPRRTRSRSDTNRTRAPSGATCKG